MKGLKLILFLLIAYTSNSQIRSVIATPTTYKNVVIDTFGLKPMDTVGIKFLGKMVLHITGVLYYFNGTKYIAVSGPPGPAGSGGGETTSGTMSQLRALTTTTGRSYTATGTNGGPFTDIGPYDGQVNDDGAIYLVTANNKLLKRQINGDASPEWWGAIAGDNLSDTAAFGKMTRYCLSNNINIHLGTGIYDLKGANTSTAAWIVPARSSNGSAIKIVGEGSRSTIVRASLSSVVLQYGTSTNDVLNGLVSSFSIQADSTVNGLSIVSSAPTSGAFTTVNDIYFKNVKDGINMISNNANTTSNYSNIFTGIRVEKYWGIGMSVSGVYNSFKDCFIVDPYGGDNPFAPTKAKGGSTLGLLVEGSNNNLDGCQFEDQINIVGNNNKITGSAIEFIKKGVPYSGIGGAGIRISGYGNVIDGMTLQGFNKNVINTICSIYGTFTSIRNLSYNNLSNTVFDVLYPILPQAGSNGTMDNVFNTPNTGNNAVFYPDNFSFNTNFIDWSLRNVLGTSGIFSRDNHLTIVETNPGALDKTVGGTVTGPTTFNSILETPQLKATSLFFDESVHKIVNSSSTDYINFVTIPTKGKRSLQNVEDISGNTATFNTGILAGSANITGTANTNILNSQLTILSGPTFHRAATYLDPSHGDTLATAVIVPDTVTYGKGVINLPNAGFGKFAGTVSGARATLPTELLRKDQQDSAIAASIFTLRNSVGTGDNIMYFPNGGTGIAKTVSVTGPTISKLVTDSTIRYIVDGITTGLAQLSGNSSSTTFDIVLASTPSWVGASNPANAASIGISYTEPITNGLRVHFTTAPPTGTNNIQFYYSYKP